MQTHFVSRFNPTINIKYLAREQLFSDFIISRARRKSRCERKHGVPGRFVKHISIREKRTIRGYSTCSGFPSGSKRELRGMQFSSGAL